MAKLRHGVSKRDSMAFPTRQLFILALCRICEPIAFMSIFPYIYFMIESFNITTDGRRIAVYAGMVTSAFTFAEFSTGMLWGRLSDRIGRKPVLLMGLAGTGVSMLIFGFSPSLPVAIFARALGGLLNGNIGVIQTTVAELVTRKEHQPRAYTVLPVVWCLGSILGPSLGGALAQPCVSYPSLFSRGTIFDKFPYLLPNLVCTSVVVFGVIVGVFFLEETHPDKKYNPDAGIEAGKRILRLLGRENVSHTIGSEKVVETSEVASLIDEHEDLPGYQSTEECPQLSLPRQPEMTDPIRLDGELSMSREKPAVAKAFTRQVVLNIIGYGILAYHTITFDQMLPVFLSTPTSNEPVSLPFKFIGGFGLTTKDVGFILMIQGLYSMFITVVVFPVVVRKIGALGLFKLMAWTYPLLYLITPYLILVPERFRTVGIYAIIVWKCTYSNFAFPASAMLMANSAPSLLLLGTINGAAASTASFCRGLGPTIAGFFYTAGLEMGCSGLAWWCTAIVTIGGAFVSSKMTDNADRIDMNEDQDEEAFLVVGRTDALQPDLPVAILDEPTYEQRP